MSNDNDDLIIDLTDLMEEEGSVKKDAPAYSEPEDKTVKPETETFDLGKELSMDDKPGQKPREEFDFDKIFRESLAGIASTKKPEPELPAKKEEQEFPFENRFNEALSEKPLETTAQEDFSYRPEEPAKQEISESSIEAAKESLMKDIPEMVESIARPVISELMGEIVSSVKRDLPGIIEKVIREEIEKLKKID